MILTFALLLASPWLVSRFLESRLAPRALVWAYFASLLAAGTAVLLMLVALTLRSLPHRYLEMAGLECTDADNCVGVLPMWADATFSFLVGGVVLGLLAFAAYAFFAQLSASRRCAGDLDLCAQGVLLPLPMRPNARLLVIEDPVPTSYTIGFLRPCIVISTGLYDALDEDELEAVLAHEEAHVGGRDNLLTLAAQTFAMTFALIPGFRFAYSRFRRAQELAADDFAHALTGDPLVVASSLEKFARSVLARGRGAVGATPAAGVGFADEGNVGERIRGLLEDRAFPFSRQTLVATLLGIVFIFGVFSSSALSMTDVALPGPMGSPVCHGVTAAEPHDQYCTGH